MIINSIKAWFKGMSYQEYLEYKIAKMKKEVDGLIEYEPNILTFCRDMFGFGRFEFGLIFYTPQLLFFIGYWFFSDSPSLSGNMIPIINITCFIALGVILSLKYPVTSDYRFSFGKKKK